MAAYLHCEVCNASFQRPGHYQRHLLTHSKEKPFSCTECGKHFARLDSLGRHYSRLHQRVSDESVPVRNRGRVSKACRQCYLSKVRCNGKQPCQRCQRISAECSYEHHQKRTSADQQSDPAAEIDANSSPSTHVRDLMETSRPAGIVSTPPSMSTKTSTHHRETNFTPMMLDTMPNDDGEDRSSHLVSDPLPTTCDISPVFYSEAADFSSFLDLDLDASLFPGILDTGHLIDDFNEGFPASMQPDLPLARIPNMSLPPADVEEIYDRAHSPPLEGETLEPRHYQPTTDNSDTNLSFPDMGNAPLEQVDQENLAHVSDVPATVLDSVGQLAETMENAPMYPRYVELRLPPIHIINSWVQLYFEYFHPLFPFLHKPTFRAPETHWLLIFAVSAIGAQFSGLPQAQDCAQSMHEMVRRQSTYLCENRNKYSRELWLAQVVLLNQLALRYSGDRRNLELAEIFQALPATLARRKRLFTRIVSFDKISQLDRSLDQKWQIWALDEGRRRTGFVIWLVEAGFHNHFDLPSTVQVNEMQNTFPQPEDCWGAPTAESWATFSLRQESHPHSLSQAIDSGSWTASWRKTGVLGKQAILQQLLNIVNDTHSLEFQDSHPTRNAVEALRHLLVIIQEEGEKSMMLELRARIAYRLTIYTALMINDLPRGSLLSIALKVKYLRNSEQTARFATDWSLSPLRMRRAVAYAAGVIDIARSNYCAHYSTPILVFRATLVLWLYSVLRRPFQESSVDAPTVVLGPLSQAQTDWVETGRGRIKLPAVGSIMSSPGLAKLLDEAISILGSLKAWGIGKIYAQVLARLRE
ncbi:hypothetical protein P170DRAFT_442902 [Aspergillus steynii IBT 23096]|uniref:Early growth response protein n=1 Tax=Aspergillus steynii IBT 23096 TaxID=1392250 RepID=A0A2I2GQ21_9EURO|nr:uncharacterized protein P170DRAFT_442902 [Aspergillus steynii IBT 23096]PLB54961.1 hypothetical protein P170DRAFT_442902 [Aspergillus steynii IBT 23096]